MRRTLLPLLAVLGVMVTGACDLSDDPPVVEQVGPTAEATQQEESQVAVTTDAADAYDEAAGRIEDILADRSSTPIETVTGKVRGTDEPFEVDIVSVRATDLSIVVHLQLRPVGGESLDLGSLDGGLSGDLAEGTRTIADIALVDEATDLRILPTVYRADVNTEDPDQRCMCSSLPSMLPPDGVRLTAHFVRPEQGFRSLIVQIPGFEDSGPLAPASG